MQQIKDFIKKITGFDENADEREKRIKMGATLTFGIGLIVITFTVFMHSFLVRNSYDLLTTTVGGKNDKAAEDVMLLLIDEDSLKFAKEAYGQYGVGRWPWPRWFYGSILQYMNMMTPPDAVFFDILFAEKDTSGLAPGSELTSDGEFGIAIENSGNIYHNVLLINDTVKDGVRSMPSDINRFFSIEVNNSEKIGFEKVTANNYTLPIPCLRVGVPCEGGTEEMLAAEDLYPRAKGLSIASFKADEDGIHRRGRILFNYGDTYFPSISLAAISALQDDAPVEIVSENVIKVGKYEIPVDDNGEYMINFYKHDEENRVKSYSMSAVFKSAVDLQNGVPREEIWLHPEDFKDKVVVIGCSAVGCQDLKNSPVSGTFPGPELHANIISNIVQGNHIYNEPAWFTYAALLFLIMISVGSVIFIHHPAGQLGIPVLFITGYVGLSFWLFGSFNMLTNMLGVAGGGVIATGLAFTFLSLTEGAEKRKYSKILGNMIDPGIVSEALNDLEALKKGGEREITAFFSDVASFSTISEKLSSADLAALLNEYLSAMTDILKEHGGTLDKYIGDAIVGIFNAPIDRAQHPLEAARASLKMRTRLGELREKWQKENAYCEEAQNMHARIGLNSGIAKVGFMGTDTLASYTMMGDTVNLAARLEAAAKDYGVDILISEDTKKKVEPEIVTRRLDLVRVKGKNEPVVLYELVCEKSELTEEKKAAIEKFEEGLNLYEKRDWQKAIEALKESQNLRGADDKSVAMLIDRCEHYIDSPPPEDWDGVFTRTHK